MDGNWPLNAAGAASAVPTRGGDGGSGLGAGLKDPTTTTPVTPVTPGATIPSSPALWRGRSASASALSVLSSVAGGGTATGTARRSPLATAASASQLQQPAQTTATNTIGFTACTACTKEHLQQPRPHQHPDAHQERDASASNSNQTYTISRPRSSPHLLLNNTSRPTDLHHTRIARMEAEERERQSIRDLADFFRSQSPPMTNLMSRPDDEGRYSEESSRPSINEIHPPRTRHIFPLFHPGKWARLKSIKSRKNREEKKKKKEQSRSSAAGAAGGPGGEGGKKKPEIKLPDSAVAGTTTGGHRHIAISIPVEYCHLEPTNRSQYPVYVPAGLRTSLDKQATKAATARPPRATTNDRGTVTVLKPVAEDRESISSSATRSQIHRFGSIDDARDAATALSPPPQHQLETYMPGESMYYHPASDSGSNVPLTARPHSSPLLNKEIDFISGTNAGGQDALIHRPEVWIPRTGSAGAGKRDSHPNSSLACRVYIPCTGGGTGDMSSKQQQSDAASASAGPTVAVYVPRRGSSVKRNSGSVAEALATLNGTLLQSQEGHQHEFVSGSNSGNSFGHGNTQTGGGGRMSMQSIAASIASNLSDNEPGVIATAQVARVRPATVLLDSTTSWSGLASSATTPPGTPSLVDFPSPPGRQDMFVKMEVMPHEKEESHVVVATAQTEVREGRPTMPAAVVVVPETSTSGQKQGIVSEGEATNSGRQRQERKSKVRCMKQRDVKLLRSRRSRSGSGSSADATPITRGGALTPPPALPVPASASSIIEESPVFKHANIMSSPRRTKSTLSITPLIVIADVEPSSPLRQAATESKVNENLAPTDEISSMGLTTTPTTASWSPGQSPPASPRLVPRAGWDRDRDYHMSRVIRPFASLPLDRTSLARRREWKESRISALKADADAISGATNSNKSVSTHPATLLPQLPPSMPTQQLPQPSPLPQQHRERQRSRNRRQTSPEAQGTGVTNPSNTAGLRPKTSGGPLRPYRRAAGGRFSELADAHDSLSVLSRGELLSRYENLRDRHLRDTERRLRRLEKNGDVWLRSIAPLLDNLNMTISGLGDSPCRRGRDSPDSTGRRSLEERLRIVEGRGEGRRRHSSSGDEDETMEDAAGGVRKSVREWRQKRGDTYHARRGSHDANTLPTTGSSSNLATAAAASDAAVASLREKASQGVLSTATGSSAYCYDRPRTAAAGAPIHDADGRSNSRVDSAAVETMERKASVRPPRSSSSKLSLLSRNGSVNGTQSPANADNGGINEIINEVINGGTPTKSFSPSRRNRSASVVTAGGETINRLQQEEDGGNMSTTSGMETLEPLMRELQGAARLSRESKREMNTRLVDDCSVFGDF